MSHLSSARTHYRDSRPNSLWSIGLHGLAPCVRATNCSPRCSLPISEGRERAAAASKCYDEMISEAAFQEACSMNRATVREAKAGDSCIALLGSDQPSQQCTYRVSGYLAI